MFRAGGGWVVRAGTAALAATFTPTSRPDGSLLSSHTSLVGGGVDGSLVSFQSQITGEPGTPPGLAMPASRNASRVSSSSCPPPLSFVRPEP